ncbi:MAG: hypothetical protein B7Y02_02020 [Rhodobacterales bacterium 17-64-5]|nr:MAG: hypothetical protein B7Y02_02020 [Rhodobacterales bacterium 17-64-5]
MPHQELVVAVKSKPSSPPSSTPLPKIHRLPAVMEATGLSRSSIYAFEAQGTFPQSVRLGSRAVGWKDDDLRAWLDSRNTLHVMSWRAR